MMSARACACVLFLLVGSLAGQSLERAWQAELGRQRGASVVGLAPVGPWLLAVDGKHGLSALDPATGQLRWFVQALGPLDHAPLEAGGLVPLVSGARVLVVAARDGRRVFERDLRLALTAAPVSDGRLLYAPAATVAGERLVAIRLSSGVEAWNLPVPGGVVAPAAWDARAGVLLACGDGRLRAIAAGEAPPARERYSVRVGRVQGRVVSADGRLYVASLDQGWTALDAGSGAVLWRSPAPGLPVGVPVPAGARVLVATASGSLALDRDTGRPAWRGGPGELPVGVVGEAVLLRRGAQGVLRALEDGARLDLDLPPGLVAASGRLLGLGSGATLSAWELRW